MAATIVNSIAFIIDGIQYTGTIESVRDDEVDVINITPTFNGDSEATLPKTLMDPDVIADHQVAMAQEVKAAAAPAMLDALMEVADVLMAYCDDHNSARPTDPTVVLDQVKAAIEQATGVPYYDEDEAQSALDEHYREQFNMLAHALRSSAHPLK